MILFSLACAFEQVICKDAKPLRICDEIDREKDEHLCSLRGPAYVWFCILYSEPQDIQPADVGGLSDS